MLSLGKLATGQAGYYLDQAHGFVTRAGSVSSGVEDYYLSGPEAAGSWEGGAAAALGLAGTVGADQLNRVLAGEHPLTGMPLGRVIPARRPGFDLTFSAPKSVSVLFGIGDDALRATVQAAHDQAVCDALKYMERSAAITRRGAGGAHAIPGNGFVAAAFRHRTSRAGDPQLHTHVLVSNLTLGADGRWSTLDGRRTYAHAKTAGYLYEARLRALLTKNLGVEWSAVRNGIADVEGAPAAVLRAFSRRRADIEAELERRGSSGAAAAQVATLATRRGKDYRVSPEMLVPEWRERAARLGLGRDELRLLCGRARQRPLDRERVEEIAERLAGPTGLTRRRSTFTRRDVVQALCEGLPATAGLDVADIERLADEFLRLPRVVVLTTGVTRNASADVTRRQDGRLVLTVPAERVYSTAELVERERAILDRVGDSRDAGLGVVASRAVERAIRFRPTISGEQAAMVRRLTQDGDGVSVVVGEAGTGKTFALAAAREAWEAGGHPVLGAALAQRAARELEDGAGISSETIAALLARLRREPGVVLPRGAVLVIDEAGMVATRELAELLEHAERANGKVVLVGDDRQLSEINAGGAFCALARRPNVIRLSENRRQVNAWERDALALLRAGDPEEAIRRFERHGRVFAADSAEAVRARLVGDWWTSAAPKESVMIAFRRVDVADLNGRARALMRASGALGESELVVDGRSFAAGDLVQLRRNDRRIGVANGDRGTVASVDPAAEALEVDLGGRSVRLDATYLAQCGPRSGPALAHGYAITGHSAQGLTCDEAFVLVSSEASREWVYTALSRGRSANRVYALPREPDERSEIAPTGAAANATSRTLEAAVGRSSAQTLATELDGRRAIADDLERAIRARDAAERELASATRERRHLEEHRPIALRRQARARHGLALADANEREGVAERMVDARRDHVQELRGRLDAMREKSRTEPAREAELPGRSFRRRDLGLER